MKIEKLLSGVLVLESNIDFSSNISHIASDHRKIEKNCIFIAINGSKRNGNDYIDCAIMEGAVAIVTDEKKFCKNNIPFILVENARSALAKAWSNFYDNPGKNIKTVAITGTNGKTSSAYFLYSILQSAHISSGLISTVECLINGEKIETNGGGAVIDVSAAMTTPDPEAFYAIYNIMKEKSVKVAVIEASSHAMEQNRLDGIDIEIGAFTNLSREHLDYHKNMEEYFSTKEKLLKISKKCVINIDDEYGKRLMEKYKNKSYSFSVNGFADFSAKSVNYTIDGCNYEMRFKDDSVSIGSKIIGKFTVYNTMLASACAKLLNIDDAFIQKGISKQNLIKGRLEQYKSKPIYIDYAHTPDAMEKVIKCMKELEPRKKLIVLFGCGGDRDKSKRPIMGNICTSLADFTVITADNSRTENVNNILQDIISGVNSKKGFAVIPSREEAIKFAAKAMGENDILLLLGKGHEEYEITSEGKKYFSEKVILDEVFSGDL
ncbi:MAG: UDP-N-acetylmuramoyl-L-alanyl-D-glutamate--2,6-diaminopimelate ligase [Ruminococcaceae bacterium]|nr:UDP-N-acetylmuramoyl-L-alanyl-D-glutamate--2,6-diaminopimelate ligase [Oscillospiraceae bacterium]